VIYFNEIRDIIFSDFKVKYTPINEVMHPPKEIIYPTDSMETVMDKFEKASVVFLPVIKNGKYHGFISKSNALEAYRSMLKTMTIE
jgi:CIC family chloride channel protein